LTGKRLTAPETFPTRAEGSKWLAQLESGALDSARVSAAKVDLRLAGYAGEWIATRNLRPRTRQLYELQFRLHIAPTLGDARLAKLEPRHIRAWHAELSAGELSDVTVAKVYRLLRSILATAVDDGLINENPCRIKGAGVERSAERPIPRVEDVVKLAAGLPDHLALVPWMAALAGLRKGELFGLARRHIDLAAGTVRVERALHELPGVGAKMAAPKSHAGNRVVTMPARLVQLVEAHLQAHVNDDSEALLFTNSHGRPIRATVWATAWNAARKEAGLEMVRLHDLRHLAGTLTAQAGATTRELMDRLGHSSVEAAMRYQHVAMDRNSEVACRIDDLIGRTEAGIDSSPLTDGRLPETGRT